jgi:hypothetical protein
MKEGRRGQMNLDAVVTKGHLPWRPSPDAQDLGVWHQYEHPLTGIFKAKEGRVIFTAVGGIETNVSVWAYACLEPGEARGLDEIEFDSVADLRAFVDEIFASHRLVLALADDLLITSWAVADEIGPLYEVATQFLEQVLAQLRSRQDPGTRFQAALAQVDAATHELVEA